MKHPYKVHEHTPLWKSVEAAILSLEENQDIKLMTPREYVIGYICQALVNERAENQSILSDQSK